MKIHYLKTWEEQSKGVIGQSSIAQDEVYYFPRIHEGAPFHMRGVTFPISIGFFDEKGNLINATKMEPQEGKASAPKRTSFAVEAPLEFFDNETFFDPIEKP